MQSEDSNAGGGANRVGQSCPVVQATRKNKSLKIDVSCKIFLLILHIFHSTAKTDPLSGKSI